MKKIFTTIALGIAIYFFMGFILIQATEQPQKIITAMAEKNLTNFIKNREATLIADTYGGQTPEETWALFVDAAMLGDTNLAQKYFWANDGQQKDEPPNFSVIAQIASAQNGQIKITQRIFENPKLAFLQNDSDIRYYEFYMPAGGVKSGIGATTPEDSVIAFPISFKFNQYSKVWKIQKF